MRILAVLSLFIIGCDSPSIIFTNTKPVEIGSATAEQCAFGGITLDSIPVCNGANGLTGAQGPQGETGAQGPQGPAGTPAQSIRAIGLCPGNIAQFPEFGLVIGQQLFAVYFAKIGGKDQAFLALLNSGNYNTTDSGNCTFNYNATTGVISNANGTVQLW